MQNIYNVNKIQELQAQRMDKSLSKEDLVGAQHRLVEYIVLVAEQLLTEHKGLSEGWDFCPPLLPQIQIILNPSGYYDESGTPGVDEVADRIEELSSFVEKANPENGSLRELLALSCTSMLDGQRQDAYFSGIENEVLQIIIHQDDDKAIVEMLHAYQTHELTVAEDAGIAS